MRCAARYFLHLVVEPWQKRELAHFVMLALHAELPLLVVTSYKQLALLCHDSRAMPSTADTLDDDFVSAEAFEGWTSRFKACLDLPKPCGSILARAPSVQITAIGDESTVRATALDLDRQVVQCKGLRLDQNW